jgi:protein ImuA
MSAAKERRRPESLAELRRDVALMTRGATGAAFAAAPIPLGLAPLDRVLGGGLAGGALHEIAGGDGGAAATGFAAFLLARALQQSAKPGFWLTGAATGRPYPPGLRHFGFDPARLWFAAARSPARILRAAEDALRSAALAAVLIEIEAADLTATRRLQLAAERGGAIGLMLRPFRQDALSAAASRWRVDALPSGSDGLGQWQVSLRRARGTGLSPTGGSGAWRMAFDHETDRLAVVALLGDGSISAPVVGARG